MTGPNQSASINILAILLVVSTVLVAVVICCIWLSMQLAKQKKKWADLLTGQSGSSLETILYDHLRERMALQSDFELLSKRTAELENKMATTKRHLGLVRYDAFPDVGGSQSFALAVFDDKGDGAIVSSLIGRSDCRVYCKPISNGKSERNLTQEEQKAMNSAVSTSPKAIISS